MKTLHSLFWSRRPATAPVFAPAFVFSLFFLFLFFVSSFSFAAPPYSPPPVATQSEAETGTSTAVKSWTPQRVAQAAAAQAGAGSTEVVDADFGAGWNGDTTHAPSKDDLYDVINPLLTAVGVAATAVDLGTFTGSTIPDSQTVKAALQALETAVEGKQATLTAASQGEMEAGTEAGIRSMSPLRVAQAIAALGSTGTGDVTGVGDCSGGACLDGSSDGGTYIRLYDSNSHYTQLAAGDSTGNLTFTLPTAAPAGNNAIVVMATTGAMSTLPSTTYQPLHSYLTDIAGLTLSQGDIFYFNGTDIVNLGPGVSGQYLQTQGAGANPQWASTSVSGDIEAIGDVASGSAFTGAGGGNTLYFEGATANDFEIALTGADPTADVIVTIPAETGTIVLGPAGFGTTNRLIKTNGTGNLTQITGISVDSSNNVSGVGTLAVTSVSPSSFVAVGTDPADAGAIRLENAAGILFEASPAGTDVNALTVTSGEVVQIGASGASGVTITPALIASAGITIATGQNLTVGSTQWNSGDSIDATKFANATVGDLVFSGGSIAVSNDSHSHTASTIPATTVYTDAATQTMSGAALIIGDADTDVLTVRSVMRGSGRAVTIDDDATSAPTYATGTNSLFVEGPIETSSNIYASGFIVVGGTGDSYVEFVNNSGGHTPAVGEYSVYFETDGSNKFKIAINGAEKEVINAEDAQTISGAKTLSSALSLNRGATGAGQLVIYEDSDDGTNAVTITIPAIAASYTLTLPTTDGNSGEYLQTNGSGALSWGAPTATAHGSDTYVQFNDGGTALGSDAGFTWNKTINALTLGADGQDGSLVLYNELGATDYSVTIQPNAAQAAAVTVTLPAATGTLATLGNAETFSGTKTFSASPIPSGATIDLGSTAAEWRNLYLTDGAIIYGQADHSNTLTSAATGWTANLEFSARSFIPTAAANAAGEFGYASNAFSWFANSEDMVATASANLWTFSSGTSATFAFTPAVGFTAATTHSAGIVIADSQTITFDESAGDPNDADIQLSATDGVFKIAATNGANNEDLTFDFDATANEVAVSSSTGVTQLRMVQGMMFGANINLVTKTSGATLAVNEMNGIVFMTGAGTIVLPEIVASSPSSSQVTPGACVCVVNRDDNEQIVIDPNANDSITLDGTKDTAGDSIQNTVTASTGGGDFACVVAVEADNWMVMGKSGTWTAN